MVLETIKAREKIARLLPGIITLGDGILNENVSAQNSANRSEIHKLHEYPNHRGFQQLPINPVFSVNRSEPPPRRELLTNDIEAINLERINSEKRQSSISLEQSKLLEPSEILESLLLSEQENNLN